MKTAIITLLTALALTSNATIIPIAVTVSASAQIQNQNVTDVNGYTTYAAPLTANISTSYLLTQLAADAYHLSIYGFPTFPSGAKLVMLFNDTNSAAQFIVTDSTGLELVDVSSVVSFEPTGNNLVYNGKRNDSNGLTTQTQRYIGTFSFDDTFAGGHTQFYLTGLVSGTITQTLLTSITYKESQSGSLKSGVGEGTLNGQEIVVTGTVSGSGYVSPIFF